MSISATVAKFHCSTVDEFGPSQRVKLFSVMGGSDENERFYKASPSGNIELTIDNPAVHGFFAEGEQYYVEIPKAPR